MRSRRLALVASVALIVAAAVLVPVTFWVLDDDSDAGGSSSDAPVVTDDPAELAAEAASVGHAVYWVGPVSSGRYELTETGDGRAYVRYLPAGVAAGDPRPRFLTVGTYLLEDAYSVTRAASRRDDARPVTASAGAVAFYTTARPQSVYLAYEGSDLQIEVFHPTPTEARRLVRTGRVRAVG